MSGLVAYMLCLHIAFVGPDSDIFTSVCCVILGVAGFLAPNPVVLIFAWSHRMKISDCVFMSFFVSFLRFFCVIQIAAIAFSKSTPPPSFVVIVGVFFALDAILDAAATYDRCDFQQLSVYPVGIVLTTEKWTLMFRIGHGVLVLVLALLGAFVSGASSRRRLALFTGFAVVEFAASVFSQLFCAYNEEFVSAIVSDMVHTSVHMIIGCFVLFFMRSVAQNQYEILDQPAVDDRALQVEQSSRDSDGPDAEKLEERDENEIVK
jgi:hypothetical protein